VEHLAVLVAVAVGAAAGFIGSIFGIGGGAIMTSFMVAAGFDIRVAVPASLLAVVGTSLGGLYVYEREGLVDYRLAPILLTATVAGSIAGVTIAAAGAVQLMRATLAAVLAYTGLTMLRGRARADAPRRGSLPLGWVASILAGMASSLAGIGGGVLLVPIMNKIVGVPIKRAVATSKMMVGVTAATGVIGYYLAGLLDSCLGLSLLAGTILGGLAGSMVGVRLSHKTVQTLFAIFLLVMSAVVVLRG